MRVSTMTQRQPTLPWLTLALAGSMVALFAAFGPAPASLVYDQVAIADGQWWRLLTAHLVHSDVQHLAWNLAGLLVLGTLLEPIDHKAFLAALFAGAIGVDMALIGLLPHIDFYCGLSGALNTLLLPLLIAFWTRTRSPLVLIIAVASLVKILVELSLGQALFTQTAWASVPAVHLAGWLAGGLSVLPDRVAALWRRTSISPYPLNGEQP